MGLFIAYQTLSAYPQLDVWGIVYYLTVTVISSFVNLDALCSLNSPPPHTHTHTHLPRGTRNYLKREGGDHWQLKPFSLCFRAKQKGVFVSWDLNSFCGPKHVFPLEVSHPERVPGFMCLQTPARYLRQQGTTRRQNFRPCQILLPVRDVTL